MPEVIIKLNALRFCGYFFTLLWSSTALGIGAWKAFFSTGKIELVYYRATGVQADLASLVLCMIFSLALMAYVIFNERKRPGYIKQVNIALLPLLLMFTTLILPGMIVTMIIFVATCGVVLFRCLDILDFSLKKLDTRYLVILTSLVNLGMVLYYWWYQVALANTLDTYWLDAGVFMEALNNTLHGNFFYSDYLGVNHFGIHFSPVLLILLPWVWAFQSVKAFFLLNSIVLFCSGWVFYYLGRSLKLNRNESLLLVLFYLFIPGISNMNRNMGYTFQEICMAVVPVTLTFAFYFRKKYCLSIICLIISLLVKENVAPFWFGVSLSALFMRRYRTSALLAVTSVAYYILVTHWVIPAFAGAQSYTFLYRYKSLGDSVGQIALSPILRTEAFWQLVLRQSTLYYVALVMLPFMLILPRSFFMAFGAFLVLGVGALQETQWNSLYQQYQTLPLIGFMFCLAFSLRLFKIRRSGFVSRLWNLGLKNKQKKQHVYIMISSLFMVGVCWVFFAQNFLPYNKVPYVEAKNAVPLINEVKKLVQPGEPITVVPEGVANLFFFRNPVSFPRRKILDKYVLIEIKRFSSSENLALYEMLCNSPEYGLKRILNSPIYSFLLFERGSSNLCQPPLFHMTHKQWNNSGHPLKVSGDMISARGQLIGDEKHKTLRLYMKLNKNSDCQLTVAVKMLVNNSTYWDKQFFGGAVVPTRKISSDLVFVWDLPLPQTGKIQTLKVDIETFKHQYGNAQKITDYHLSDS